MALVAPLRGIHFNQQKVSDLAEVVTPPYDVISEKDGAAYLEKNPYSMIRLDLRNTSGKSERGASNYEAARDLFNTWLKEGVLKRDAAPAMYLYITEYTHPSGRKMTRKGLVSLVGLAEFSEGIVKPHEQTFEGVIGDRLRLMETCKAQFSQIFSIYPDRENAIIEILEAKKEEEPLASVSDHNRNTHTLWRITDNTALKQVAGLFADKSLYIADGHHRYTTSLALQRKMQAQNPSLPADSPYNFIMMYLCSMSDPGLSVLPAHRLVRFPGTMSSGDLVSKMAEAFTVEPVRGGSREELVAALFAGMEDVTQNSSTIGVYHPGEDKGFVLKIDAAGKKMTTALADTPEVLRDLDVVVLSELIIEELLGIDHDRAVREDLVKYISDPDEALDLSVKMSVDNNGETPLLFLLNPTRVEQVQRVADSRKIMPHKSTYFYPKILTGLLLHKLDEQVTSPAS